MQPLFGPNVAPVLPVSVTPAVRLADGAQPDRGEAAAARLRAETTERVDPPRAQTGPKDVRLGAERRAEPPPDPNAPAGPPPAFAQSVLERQREELLAPASLVADLARPEPLPEPASQALPQADLNVETTDDAPAEAKAVGAPVTGEGPPSGGFPEREDTAGTGDARADAARPDGLDAPGPRDTSDDRPARDFVETRRALAAEVRPSVDVIG